VEAYYRLSPIVREAGRFSFYFRQMVIDEKLTVGVSGLGGWFHNLAWIAPHEAK